MIEHGIVEDSEKKHFVEKLKASAAEATRGNVAYMNHAVGKSITDALKGLSGF